MYSNSVSEYKKNFNWFILPASIHKNHKYELKKKIFKFPSDFLESLLDLYKHVPYHISIILKSFFFLHDVGKSKLLFYHYIRVKNILLIYWNMDIKTWFMSFFLCEKNNQHFIFIFQYIYWKVFVMNLYF